MGEKCGCDMYESNVHIIKHWNTLPYFQQQPHPLHKQKTQTKQKPANSSGFAEVIMYTPTSPRERSSVSVADIGFIPRSCISPIPRPWSVPFPDQVSGLRMKLLQCMPHLAKEREELAGSCILICFLLLLLLLLSPPPLLFLLLLHTKTLQASLHEYNNGELNSARHLVPGHSTFQAL